MAESINLFDTATYLSGHPHGVYDALRAEAPVYRHGGTEKQPPFWLLTRYADVEAVSRNNKQFTSTRGFRLPTDRKLSLDPAIQTALMRQVLAMDPPDHMKIRKLLNPSFMPAALSLLEQGVQAYIAELMDRLKPGSTVEFVEDVAAVIPIKSICKLLGIPAADEGKIFDWTNRLVGADDPEYAPSLEETNRTYSEVFEYGRWLMEQRRANPANDLMSVVANAEIDGQPIDPAARDGFCILLVAAGNETTRNSLTGAIWALTKHPDARRKLLAQPDLIPGAVEEFLRYVTPVIQMMRTATEDVEVGGQTIKAGERVVMLYGAANHDPAMFTDPHILDPTRENAKKHLAFGIGIHHCLGARLATLQLRAMLAALLHRFPNVEAVSEPTYLASNFVLGMKSLDVKLH